jgi:hypothetical protein
MDLHLGADLLLARPVDRSHIPAEFDRMDLSSA